LPSLRHVVDDVAPSVVAINVRSVGYDFFLRPVTQRASGTGVILRDDGYIVTNDHVVGDARTVQVTLFDGRTFEAELVGRYRASDIAVLRIEAAGLAPLGFSEPGSLQVGDWVVAMGNALGLEGAPTVTIGIVSALGRTITSGSGITLADLVQTDAAINQGNSGGPLVNLKGELVGLNTTIIAEAQGIGFAVSSALVQRYADDLIEHGRVVLPFFGISGETLNKSLATSLGLDVSTGVIVAVLGDGPARRGGVELGDVIVALDDRAVRSYPEFLSLLWGYEPEDTVRVTIVREGEELVLSVTLEQRSE
jgi:S1-C subfamily serine protease